MRVTKPDLHHPITGEVWCQFRAGSTECANERRCRNPWHRDGRGVPEVAWWFIGLMSTGVRF